MQWPQLYVTVDYNRLAKECEIVKHDEEHPERILYTRAEDGSIIPLIYSISAENLESLYNTVKEFVKNQQWGNI